MWMIPKVWLESHLWSLKLSLVVHGSAAFSLGKHLSHLIHRWVLPTAALSQISGFPKVFQVKGEKANPSSESGASTSQLAFYGNLFWKGLGEGWVQPYSYMEVLLNTGAPEGKQENVNTLHCLKIPELWGHQLSALHKVLNFEQTLTAKIQNISIFCMPFYTLPCCCQALELSYGVVNIRS